MKGRKVILGRFQAPHITVIDNAECWSEQHVAGQHIKLWKGDTYAEVNSIAEAEQLIHGDLGCGG